MKFSHATTMDDLEGAVEQNGFAVISLCLDEGAVERLRYHLDEKKHAQRNLLSLPTVRELAKSEPVREIVNAVLGRNCFAVKGILFNKTQESNWKVVWHQDLTIAVRQRREVSGFGPWTQKAGIPHVQPPSEIMSRILALRLHLDDSGADNGPLRVIAGSHKEGRLSVQQVANWQKSDCVTCVIPKGGVAYASPAPARIVLVRCAPATSRDSFRICF